MVLEIFSFNYENPKEKLESLDGRYIYPLSGHNLNDKMQKLWLIPDDKDPFNGT
jgi:hypothetical protein